jgi:hypothetical protein
MLKKGPAPTPSAPPVTATVPAATGSAPGASDAAGASKAAPTGSKSSPESVIPEPPSSVEEDSELDLEPDPGTTGENTVARPVPHLQRLLGPSDHSAEVDNTHTSIDVKLTLAAAKKIEAGVSVESALASRAPASSSPKPVSSFPVSPASSGRLSKPPPLPPSTPYELNEPPTAPARMVDPSIVNAAPRLPISDHALAMTDENGPVDFSDHTGTNETTLSGSHRSVEIPPDILSSTDLAALDEDDEEVNKDVLVVDEFVEDVDDEYEDVAEPSKPHGPLPQ